MSNLKRIYLVGLILSISSGAQAATLCVHPDGNGNCESSIQNAVDAASAGDTIKIKPGTYYEAVNVDKSLTIKGSKQSIIDADDKGTALTIEADDVTVMNLAIHNPGGYGIYVDGYDNAVIKGVHIRNSVDECIYLNSTSANAIIEKNLLHSCGSTGIYLEGNNATVSKNRITQADSVGIDLDCSDDAVIEKNIITQVTSTGIEQCGDGATIAKNKVSYADGDGIALDSGYEDRVIEKNLINQVDGDGIDVGSSSHNTSITNNKVTHAIDDGINVSDSDNVIVSRNTLSEVDYGVDLTGDNPRVERNRVANFESDGIEINCNDSCDSALIEANIAKGGFGGSDHCFDITLNADGTLINKNLGQGCSEDGFEITGGGDAEVTNNRSINAGGDNDGDGFDIQGLGKKTLTKNLARGSSDDGFDIDDGDIDPGVDAMNVLDNNRAIDNGGDGFEINFSSDATTLTNNKAIRNNRNGISLLSDDNTVTGNKASNNREGFDFCDEGSGNTLTDNKFGSETTSCTP